MNMKIIVSTRNPSKVLQIKDLLAGLPLDVLTLAEAGIEGEAVEDGSVLQENAIKKARFAFENADHDVWAIADDTGLFIKALGGLPGVKSGRWAGESASTEETIDYCLNALRGIRNRSATFVTVVAVITPEGDEYCFEGSVNGRILEIARVKPQPKMPYNALFVPNGTDKVWAEMTVAEENAISHRGIAFRQAREFLEEAVPGRIPPK
jgi:XTP/dITP diphosphohydrolase